VRIEAWQSNGFKRVLEERPDCICVAPMPACQSCRLELAIMAMFDEGCRKQRVVQPPEPISCQKFDPFDDNPLSVASDREESRRLRLLFLVFTSRGSGFTRPSVKSTCLTFKEANAPSRTPVSHVNAITARLLRSISVLAGMARRTHSICSGVGIGRAVDAFAIRASFSESRK
jgi:hypothetical protein